MTVMQARTEAIEVPLGLKLADLVANLEDTELFSLCRANVKAHEEIIQDVYQQLPLIRALEETAVNLAIAAERLPREWGEFTDAANECPPGDPDITRTWRTLREACSDFAATFNKLMADMDAFEEAESAD